MGLSYLQIHLRYTLPAVAALLVVARPLLTRFDIFKVSFIIAMAFAAATPWDSWVIRRGIWGYPPGSVVGTLWDVPFEEYAFFGIQTVVTGLVYIILTRPLLPSLSLPHTPASKSTKLLLSLSLLPVAVLYNLSSKSDHFLYLFAEVLLVTPPLLLLFGTSARFAFSPSPGRRTATILSIALPTVYLAWAERTDQVPSTVEGRERILVKSREMGTALQLVNIARDIAGDGQEGRCYLPMSWFSKHEPLPRLFASDAALVDGPPEPHHLTILLEGDQVGYPWSTYSLPLLHLADNLALSARPGIDMLPASARAGVRAAAGGYLLIGKEIRARWKGDVRERRVVKGWKRVLKVVGEVWGR